MGRLLLIACLIGIVFTRTIAQVDLPNSESTVYLTGGSLQRDHDYSNQPPTHDSYALAGAGFRYEHFFSTHFSVGPDFEVAGTKGNFLGTITANLGYSVLRTEASPDFFLECGYGITAPAIFLTELLRFDVGTLHLGGGMKLSIADNRLLRVGLSYRRFRTYENDSATNFITYSFVSISVGYSIVSFE